MKRGASTSIVMKRPPTVSLAPLCSVVRPLERTGAARCLLGVHPMIRSGRVWAYKILVGSHELDRLIALVSKSLDKVGLKVQAKTAHHPFSPELMQSGWKFAMIAVSKLSHHCYQRLKPMFG